MPKTTLRWALGPEQPVFGPPVSVGQPRQGADLTEAALQDRPALAAVGAAVDLPEGRGGIDQLWVRRVNSQEIGRAFDLAGQPRILPFDPVIAAAEQAAGGTGWAVAVGHEHDACSVRALDDGASVLPCRINRAHRPTRSVVAANMQAGIRGGEKNPTTVVHDGETVNVLRLHPLVASFPPFAAVDAPPRAVDLHPGEDDQ